MKNIHVLPTDKPSRLYYWEGKLRLGDLTTAPKNLGISNQNIYITSDEEIKEGDYFIAYSVTSDKKPYISCASEYKERKKEKGKIILTDNQDLIKDGVQAIDDEFLEWFIKNPSCESVEVDKTIPCNFDGLDSVRQDKFLELFYKSELFDEIKYSDVFDWSVNEGKDYLKLFQSYKIIIPKEEPKQETLDEFKKRFANDKSNKDIELGYQDGIYYGIEVGSKWQQERMYSEEEVDRILRNFRTDFLPLGQVNDLVFNEWFEQIKKK